MYQAHWGNGNLNSTQLPKIMFIMRGWAGCGKTTKALEMQHEEFGGMGVILSASDFFLNERGIYDYNHFDLARAHTVNVWDCRVALNEGISPIWIDNSNRQLKHMRVYVQMARSAGYTIRFVQPDVSWTNAANSTEMIQICFERNRKCIYTLQEIENQYQTFQSNTSITTIMRSF